ncbi:interferon-induced protein 44-like isoform X2 [Pseudorasbora parva]|uniref:interferon-induced protein 44-like isoform X2 n=1 Tax=Pseudorasbora parva TaxID=51549 RepID=UPI00351DCC60
MGGSASRPDPTPSKPDPPPRQELETPWRRIVWGQKEVLKKRLEELSLTIHRFINANGYLPFSLIDTMGLQPTLMAGCLPEDIINAVYGHVKTDYEFDPEEPLSHRSEDYISDPLLSDQAFCLVYIVDATTIDCLDERLADKLLIIRRRITDKRIPQVIIMTKVDEACPLVKKDLKKIYNSRKINEKVQMCSNKIGVPVNHIFPVKNYNDEININDDVDVLILKALDQIVNLANNRLRDAASN